MITRLFATTILIMAFTSVRAQTFEAHGPHTFREILQQSFNNSWTPSAISSIDNLSHVVILDAETKTSVVMLDDESHLSLNVNSIDSLSSSKASYSSLLRGIFQMVDVNTNSENEWVGQYLMHPLLHSYYAIDANGSDAVVSDAGSFYAESSDGFLLFELEGSSTNTTIKAVAQYTYSTSDLSYENNASWSEQWLMIDNDDLFLTSTEEDATSFFLADALDLINFSLEEGSDFNPAATEWQDNKFADFPDNVWDYEDSDLFGDQFTKDIDEIYQEQFGNSDEANSAAEAALEEIETTLIEAGETLRYHKSVYLEFRDNMLSRTFGANDLYNSVLGESTVEYVYFTNAKNDEAEPHPFMVIASHNASDGPNFLIDVARPPGDGEGSGYEEQSITRNGILEVKLVKIPLKDYGLIDELTDNDLSPYGSLASDLQLDASEYDVYNYAGTSSNGIAIDGVVIYPAYNNNLRFAAVDAEITSTGIHVGRGMGLHYHADGHGYSGNGLNLYNYPDYEDKEHPPLIGFAYDGIALFGKYEVNYPDMEGYDDSLDEFGGHDHSSFGYHYHAFAKEVTHSEGESTVGPFIQHFLLVGAWKGDINEIPGLLEVSSAQLKDTEVGRFAGAPYDETDPGTTLSIDNDPNYPIKVFPNPSFGIIEVLVGGVENLILTDLNGKKLQSIKTVDGKAMLDLTLMESGIYLLNGTGNQSSFVRKIILR